MEKITAVDETTPATEQHAYPFDRSAFNLPNCITISRLVLAFVLFAMIYWGGVWISSTIVFAIAAATDAVDGYLARRYGLVTTLGRILDPFVDKIIVCGAFVFLLAIPDNQSGVGPWMVLIVIGREMFITGLRSFLEQRGQDFSASLSGKLKMIAQCLAVGFCLISLSVPVRSAAPWIVGLRDLLLWTAIGFTLISGILYVRRAAQLLRSA